MAIDRYVVLGLAHVRSEWFVRVARWSTMGTIPVTFHKCVGPAELRAQLRSGRPCSAILVDGTLPSVDRDLLAAGEGAGAGRIVVDAAPHRVDWMALGADAVADPALDHVTLLHLLATHARPVQPTVPSPAAVPLAPDVLGGAPADPPPSPAPLAPMIAVVGRSGSGTSTIAIAAAQALARRAPAEPTDPPVVLADLARLGHQALLHDAVELVPGLEEVLAAVRTGQPSAAQVRTLTHPIAERGYAVVLGLRHRLGWVDVQARTLRAAIASLRAASSALVVDIDADLEGEAEVGSFDVEDRHLLARTAATSATLVLAVGRPGATGLHGLVLLVDDLVRAGVAPERIALVANRAPRRPGRRAELAGSLAGLLVRAGHPEVGPTAFVPDRAAVELAHLTVTRLPHQVERPVGALLAGALERLDASTAQGSTGPTPVQPGELGSRPLPA